MNPAGRVPLKILLDQGIPAQAAFLFRELGYECRHVSEFGMQRAEDEDILAYAQEGGYVIITLDADFHALVAVRSLRGPSIIRLRREGCRAEDVVRHLAGILERYGAELMDGALISVKARRVTCHRLPVGGEGAGGSGDA